MLYGMLMVVKYGAGRLIPPRYLPPVAIIHMALSTEDVACR